MFSSKEEGFPCQSAPVLGNAPRCICFVIAGDVVYAIVCNEVEILGKTLKNRNAAFLKPGAGGAGTSGCYQQEPSPQGHDPQAGS